MKISAPNPIQNPLKTASAGKNAAGTTHQENASTEQTDSEEILKEMDDEGVSEAFSEQWTTGQRPADFKRRDKALKTYADLSANRARTDWRGELARSIDDAKEFKTQLAEIEGNDAAKKFLDGAQK